MAKVVGIDLGTTYSALSVFEKKGAEGLGQAIIIPNLKGKYTTPSVISVNKKGEIIVGWAAKNNLENNPDNTILEVKRLMGCNPPEIKAETDNRGLILNKKEYQPQQLSSFILKNLKAAAEHYLGEEVFDAVITCPAYFHEPQKQATKEAGILAGFNVHRVLAEPVAAAVAYGVEKAVEDLQVFVVYDLGGGTFDVSVITVEGNDIEVVGTAGDPKLGGGDFDDKIVDWVIAEIKKNHDIDLTNDTAAKARIKTKAENAKIELSTAQSADIQIPFITMTPSGPLGDTFTLSRVKFEMMIMPLLKKTVGSVRDALRDAKEKDDMVTEDSITAILMVGGSSRIPCIKKIVEKEFPNMEIRGDLNPDQIVAQGAAIVASNLAPVGKPPSLDGKIETPPKVPADETYGIDVNIRNVVSHTLGIALGPERKSHPMIKKNFDIPFQTSESHFTTVVDNQPKVMIEVYEGEGEFVDAPDMTKVGEFELSGWEPGPAGHVQFKIDFSIDMNGILTVSATEIKSNIKVEETFKRDDAVKTLEDMQQEVNEISQEGVKQSREASAGTPAQPSRMEPPPGLPEEYAGYWAEAAAKIPSLEPTLAEGLKAKMAELAKAVQSGDADSIEKTGQELTEQMYELM